MVKLEDAFSSKKSYDKPRQHLKKQRHYFADEVLSSQSNGFSSSHVWMWELDNKKGWEPKNWCHLTVVLEKTLLRGPWTARWRRERLPTLLWPGEFMGSQSMGSPQSMGLQRVGHDWVTFTFTSHSGGTVICLLYLCLSCICGGVGNRGNIFLKWVNVTDFPLKEVSHWLGGKVPFL